jgi:hypothetical protein
MQYLMNCVNILLVPNQFTKNPKAEIETLPR